MTSVQAYDKKDPRDGNPFFGDIILETVDLTKDFGGFVAVNGVSLRVRRGTIHALIGPNGAGKTTCFNLLTKVVKPSRGAISFLGREITRAHPAEVARLGIARSFQISAVFAHLTAFENVRIALQRERGRSFDFWRSAKVLHKYHERAMDLLASVDLADSAYVLAGHLSYGNRRALEIATTLALDPELMLLDEPTAGVGSAGVERIVDLIQKASVGRTILMVEHNLGVVSTLSDHVTVMARGEVLADGDYRTVSKNANVIHAYLGGGHGHA